MMELIFCAYPKAENGRCYQETADETIRIFEDQISKRCFIKTKENEASHFVINNPNQKQLGFLAIDFCCFDEKDGKKCDCLVHSNSTICFIELKNANKNKGQRRKAAREQLEASICHLKSNIDITPFKLEAYMAVGTLSNTYPRQNASNQEVRLYFKTKLNTDLFEGNQMTF